MTVEEAIEEYQCLGCIHGSSLNCGKHVKKNCCGVGCNNHIAATFGSNSIGTFFLGMPKGFCRIGAFPNMKLQIFENFKELKKIWGDYDFFNIPVWKHLNENNHILIRGLSPRINIPFLHIILDGNLDDINCLEVTKQQIDEMD